jgi:hypothetical protein
MILVDADIVVVRHLGALVERAAAGRIVAFRDHQDRFCEQWGELLGLGVASPRPYVSSSLVLLGGEVGGDVLQLLDAARDRVDFERTLWRRNEREYPFLYADQDVLNAILASRVGADRLVALDAELAPTPPFEGLRLTATETLACATADGREVYLVHHSLSPKPWQEPAYEGVYSRLLRRLLTSPDVAVRVPGAELPRTLRRGPIAHAERQLVKVREQLRWRVGGFVRERLGVGAGWGDRVT